MNHPSVRCPFCFQKVAVKCEGNGKMMTVSISLEDHACFDAFEPIDATPEMLHEIDSHAAIHLPRPEEN